MLFVGFIHALIRIALRVTELVRLLLFPLTVPALQAVQKLASVATAVRPLVLAETFWFTLFVLTYVTVAIGKEIRAIALSQTGVPLALILVPIGKHVHAIPLSLRLDPLTDVTFSIATLPDTISMFDALQPFTVVHFAILPLVHTFTICFIVFIGAMVRISI